MKLPENIGLPSVEEQMARDLAKIAQTTPKLAEAIRRASTKDHQNANAPINDPVASAFTDEQIADAKKHDLFHRTRLGDDF